MKKILMTPLILAVFLIIPTMAIAAPSCNTTPDGVPKNAGDPACYTTKTVDCIWKRVGVVCYQPGATDVNWFWGPSKTCIGVTACPGHSGYICEGDWYQDSCKGDKSYYCTNDGPMPENYKVKKNTCHYLTVNEWSECDLKTGIRTATSVTQHSTSGKNCDNLNESTTQFCPACGIEVCPGLTEAPSLNLCTIGSNSVPILTNNEWTWTCSENNMSVDCGAPCDEDGKCAPGNPGAQGEYAWNAIEFRGELCEGGTPTISTDFDSALPMPVTSGSPTTVTWGCDHIGVGTSTATDACSASRLAPKPGVCGPDDQGEFDNISDLNESCCNPDSYPPCTTDNTFASPISQSGKSWNWTCNGSKNDGTDAVNCAAECIPEIDVNVSPNPFPLTEDGVTVEVTVTKTGVCAGEYTCTVDGQGLNGNNKVIFNNLNSPKDIVIICDGKTIDTIHIAGYCTARACNAQGTCQSTPVVSDSYNASACSSTCNSNADCSSGRLIETKP